MVIDASALIEKNVTYLIKRNHARDRHLKEEKTILMMNIDKLMELYVKRNKQETAVTKQYFGKIINHISEYEKLAKKTDDMKANDSKFISDVNEALNKYAGKECNNPNVGSFG